MWRQSARNKKKTPIATDCNQHSHSRSLPRLWDACGNDSRCGRRYSLLCLTFQPGISSSAPSQQVTTIQKRGISWQSTLWRGFKTGRNGTVFGAKSSSFWPNSHCSWSQNWALFCQLRPVPTPCLHYLYMHACTRACVAVDYVARFKDGTAWDSMQPQKSDISRNCAALA